MHLVKILKGTILAEVNDESMQMKDLAVEAMKIKWTVDEWGIWDKLKSNIFKPNFQ